MRVLARVETALLNQTGQLFQWSPVCLAIGIGLYFSLRFEAGWQVYACLLAAIAIACAIVSKWRSGWVAL